MPIFWRYLSKAYIKVFLLCTFGFISILLITRLRDIAKFAALSPNISKIVLFTLLQIPHILPIAIPISCLISSFLLFQRYSRTSELTALRASGLSIKKIILPIVIVSLFISFFNFFITSEITPLCQIHSKKIAHEEITLNPIMLMEKPELLKIKNSYIDLQVSDDKNSARDLLFITANKSNGRLNLITSKKIELEKDNLLGENISIVSYFQSEKPDDFDLLLIENQKKMKTPASNLSKYMKSPNFSLNPVHLPTKMVLIRSQMKNSIDKISRVLLKTEIFRRIALSLSAFSFTFIGICFGINISRTSSLKKVVLATVYALLILLSFTIAKSFKQNQFFATLFLLFPQVVILVFSSRALYKISRGIE